MATKDATKASKTSNKTVKTSTKPVLRNLLLTKTKKDFALALSFALTIATSYYMFVKRQRRKTFEEFHRTYDAEAAYKRMKAKGVFRGLEAQKRSESNA
ncbi:cytochrome c oxidase subunit 6C [Biomphalaria pfeifferi]|uniref:Cytochrome c oxidase subunit 6C n=1 Tax=Biomphalaria pfeifferi TaxID=112525 RepID=A0AAD8BYH0_BIOPF|nr:cytochrome c oxidase subunit 6C [Biomphalaria pfeifferi]